MDKFTKLELEVNKLILKVNLLEGQFNTLKDLLLKKETKPFVPKKESDGEEEWTTLIKNVERINHE